MKRSLKKDKKRNVLVGLHIIVLFFEIFLTNTHASID